MNKLSLTFILTSVLLLQGCVGAAVVIVASGVSVVTDERSLSSQLDDQAIELSASTKIAENEALNSQTNIQVVSINGTILLVGQAPSEHLRDAAIKIAAHIPGVVKVHNQVRISNTLSFSSRSHDVWLTSKVKTALFGSDKFDATNIKVISENGEVFLMGIVNKKTATAAVEIARNVSGVNKVFKAFEYI
jgi:osmotically-inducible protein OsmY